ncbi:MAG: tRNA (adenosine(37)-N6)-threonylcarbamoyltransferase complex transferase subunit TsaD [Planctomycetota bacterium]
MKVLCIETTCDETGAAVVTDDLEVLGAVVASQEKLHERFGGVVPEVASRAHVERVLPVIDETLGRARVSLTEIDAVAVANTPGLSGSLLVGLTAAKTLALAVGKPLVAIDHLQAHVYACRMADGPGVFPCVGMVVSGGHSNLYRCGGPTDFTPLGATIDDAAGEAFDKVASLLGLPYPGGPSIQKAAATGDPARFRFPRPLLDDRSRIAFSFSGLKTAVRYEICGPGQAPRELSEQEVADLAAGFQEAVVDCLVGKAELALQQTGFATLCVGGGVGANGRLRERLEASSVQRGYRLHIAPLDMCTDNAVMGAIAIEKLKAGIIEGLNLDIEPGVRR